MMFSHPESTFHTLYCEEEESWDNGEFIEGEGDSDTSSLQTSNNELLFVEMSEHDDEELNSLLKKEEEIEADDVFDEMPVWARARGEAVEWILRVTGFYSFSSQTAVFAVDYLDRFLCNFKSCTNTDKPWTIHLAAVACLSLAAKVEEIKVPLLLDLQVENSKYVFEAKIIQRMEILVLSTLQWKMNPVIPHSFLDYIVRKLGLNGRFCRVFLRRWESLLLSVVSDWRFLGHLPSALATATMLYVISFLEPSIGVEYQDQLISILGINKDRVDACCILIQEIAIKLNFHSNNKRKFGLIRGSPKGVDDVCFSSDSSYISSSSWTIDPYSCSSVSSSSEPLSKRIKSEEWMKGKKKKYLPS